MNAKDFSITELKMIYEALNFYLAEKDSFNADLIIDIQDKIDEYTEAV